MIFRDFVFFRFSSLLLRCFDVFGICVFVCLFYVVFFDAWRFGNDLGCVGFCDSFVMFLKIFCRKT